MNPRTLEVQNQIRSTTSGIEYDDTLTLALATSIVNDSFITDPTQVSGTLIMDLNFIRTAIRDIKGSTPLYHWYDPVVTTAGLITLSGARTALNHLQSFVGAEDDADAAPTYSSTNFITQAGSLETAVGQLDAALFAVSGTSSNVNKRTLIRTGNQFPKDVAINITAPGTGWNAYGDSVTWTSANDFIENISVFHNGVLQLPASGIADQNDVYNTATPSSLAFAAIIRKNDVIQIWRTPGA